MAVAGGAAHSRETPYEMPDMIQGWKPSLATGAGASEMRKSRHPSSERQRLANFMSFRGVTITTVIGGFTTAIAGLAWLYVQWSASDLQRRTDFKQLLQSSEEFQVISEQLRQPCTTADCGKRFNELWARHATNHYDF